MKIINRINQVIGYLKKRFSIADDMPLFGSSKDYDFLSKLLQNEGIAFQTIDSIYVISVLDYKEEIVSNIQNSLIQSRYDEDIFTDNQISYNGDHVYFRIGSLDNASTYILYAVLYPYEFSLDPVLLWLREVKTMDADYLKKISRYKILNKER